MSSNGSIEKNTSFVQPPSSLLPNSVVQSLVPNISQEDREMLKAGYHIYHILLHRETLVLIIDTGKKQIVENEGNITLKCILSNSELSDVTVTQLLLHK